MRDTCVPPHLRAIVRAVAHARRRRRFRTYSSACPVEHGSLAKCVEFHPVRRAPRLCAAALTRVTIGPRGHEVLGAAVEV